jgi:hypothetical protein
MPMKEILSYTVAIIIFVVLFVLGVSIARHPGRFEGARWRGHLWDNGPDEELDERTRKRTIQMGIAFSVIALLLLVTCLIGLVR